MNSKPITRGLLLRLITGTRSPPFVVLILIGSFLYFSLRHSGPLASSMRDFSSLFGKNIPFAICNFRATYIFFLPLGVRGVVDSLIVLEGLDLRLTASSKVAGWLLLLNIPILYIVSFSCYVIIGNDSTSYSVAFLRSNISLFCGLCIFFPELQAVVLYNYNSL